MPFISVVVRRFLIDFDYPFSARFLRQRPSLWQCAWRVYQRGVFHILAVDRQCLSVMIAYSAEDEDKTIRERQVAVGNLV